jgi:hypothetical protein
MLNAANRSPFGALLREFRLAVRLSQEAWQNDVEPIDD